MTDDDLPAEVEKSITDTLTDDEQKQKQETQKKQNFTPTYEEIGSSKIPVSRRMGKFWKMRLDEGKRILEQDGTFSRWEEAIAAYERDHTNRENKRGKLAEVGKHTDSSKRHQYATENIIFANVSAIVPSVYAKNPEVECTATKSENEEIARVFGKLITTLYQRKQWPGLGLKNKLKAMVCTTLITNRHYCELSYTQKQDSSENAMHDIAELSKELEKAKDIDKIKELEGKLMALDERVAVLEPSGPAFNTRSPKLVIEDPDNIDGDFTQNKYVIVGQMMRTSMLNALYRKKKNGEVRSAFKPTHVVPNGTGDANISGHDIETQNFMLLKADEETTSMKLSGYDDEDAYKDACRTLTWSVWDKTTRRLYLFSDKDWKWPIWVWDDPYQLARFYPIFPLSFQTPITDRYGKSEVMYYLDQQEELNVINEERARMRHWISTKVFYDKNAFEDTKSVEQMLSTNTNENYHGIDLPDGRRIQDMIGTMPAPSMAAQELFDPTAIISAVNRLSSVTPIMQSQQFKTNTTNRAIESYESTTATRLDEKIDAVEDMLGEVGYALLEMVLQFMPQEDIENLIGAADTQVIAQYIGGSPQALVNEFDIRIVGGSTNKPTSKAKKDQAMNLGQILGQFANASPMVILVMLKALERAFGDDIVITDEEWDKILQSTQQSMMRGNSQPGAQQGQQPQAQGQSQQKQEPEGREQAAKALEQIGQRMDALPPEKKQQIAQAFAGGRGFQEIVAAVVQEQRQPQ
jgi:hypothetical protein